MKKYSIITLLILSMFLNTELSSYNNSLLGNSRKEFPSSYEYQYSTSRQEPEEYRTGRGVNYYYVPRRPGTHDCERWDRNYIRCK